MVLKGDEFNCLLIDPLKRSSLLLDYTMVQNLIKNLLKLTPYAFIIFFVAQVSNPFISKIEPEG